MKYIPFISLLFFIASLPGLSFAGSQDYKCKIERVSFAEGDDSDTYKMFAKAFIGEEFTVDRKTGLMVGSLKNSYVTSPQVIDIGSSENSYKVVSTMRVIEGAGAGSNIYALNVEEFVEGPTKPFIFLQNNKVFFGSCEHF